MKIYSLLLSKIEETLKSRKLYDLSDHSKLKSTKPRIMIILK